MTPSLQQLLSVSFLLTVAEKVIEAGSLAPPDIHLMQLAVERVRSAFAMPVDGRSEVKRPA